MDSYGLYTLIVFFFEGLVRRSRSKTVAVLRWLALGCVISGPACLASASFLADEELQSLLLISGTVLLLAFLPLTIWSAFLVGREQVKK